MVEDDVMSWNTIIGAHAQHCCGEDAFQCFTKMEMAGVRPKGVIFVGFLTGCSHAGLVNDHQRE